MPAFVCSGLSVAYGGREALSDIDFELPRAAATASHILELGGRQKYFGESCRWPGGTGRTE